MILTEMNFVLLVLWILFMNGRVVLNSLLEFIVQLLLINSPKPFKI